MREHFLITPKGEFKNIITYHETWFKRNKDNVIKEFPESKKIYDKYKVNRDIYLPDYFITQGWIKLFVDDPDIYVNIYDRSQLPILDSVLKKNFKKYAGDYVTIEFFNDNFRGSSSFRLIPIEDIWSDGILDIIKKKIKESSKRTIRDFLLEVVFNTKEKDDKEVYIKSKEGEALCQKINVVNEDEEIDKIVAKGGILAPKRLKLIHIEIKDRYKGKGIGSQLMQAVIDYAKKENYPQVYLQVLPYGYSEKELSKENLIKFYKKFGFEFIKGYENYMVKDI